MKKFLLLILITHGTFIFINCSEDSNSMSSYNNERYFSLFFYSNFTPQINAGFWTLDISEIPTVTINGVNMELFWPQGRSIEGRIYNLPHSETMNYVISGSGKLISSSILMPTTPYNVSCNGIILEEDVTNYIHSSNSFNFS
jgi:hypothetical protein